MSLKFTHKDFKKEYKQFKDADNMATFVLFEPVFFAWQEAIPCYGVDDMVYGHTFERHASEHIYSVNGKLVTGTVREELIQNHVYRTSIEFEHDGRFRYDKLKSKEIESGAIRGFKRFFRKEFGLEGLMEVGKKVMHNAIHYTDYDEKAEPNEVLWTAAALQVGEPAIAFYLGTDEARKIIEQVQLEQKEGSAKRPRIACCPT